MMRKTRAASKRAALDESKNGDGGIDQGRNKRPALANISNATSQNQAADGSKAISATVNAIVKENVPLGGTVGSPSIDQSPGLTTGKENSTPLPQLQNCENSDNYVTVSSGTMASLERRTLRNLHISSQSPAKKTERGRSAIQSQSRRAAKGSYINIDDKQDAQMCSAHAADIYKNYRMMEITKRPSVDYLEKKQPEVNVTMRAILIDWLVEVAEEYRLVPDTLYLSINILDRYLSATTVSRGNLQLAGISSVMLAAKMEEIFCPSVAEFCFITDDTYEQPEVLKMEIEIATQLNFEFNIPTIKAFLRRFVRAGQVGLKVPSIKFEFLANFLAELTLTEYSFLKYPPSMIAASAVFLSKITVFPNTYPWTPTLHHYTEYCPSELKECVLGMLELHKASLSGRPRAIREKYSAFKFKSVATEVKPIAEAKSTFFDDLNGSEKKSRASGSKSVASSG